MREVAKERAEVRKGASAEDGKRMEPLTVEELYRIFEPPVWKYMQFQWLRLTGWRMRNSMTDSFLEWMHDPDMSRKGSNIRGRDGLEDDGVP